MEFEKPLTSKQASTVSPRLSSAAVLTGTESLEIPGRLRSETRAVEDLTPWEVERMHLLFSKYYEQHPLESFQRDLLEKDHVILLRDAQDRTIQGFSTLLKVSLPLAGKAITGVYSGDTVIEKRYWGSPALGLAFLTYLWKEKIKSPWTPLYWFLISKGYKTYLLMANNFHTHYPRYEKSTPHEFQKLMDLFYGTRFAKTYDSQAGLIRVEDNSCRLKEQVADITPRLLENPRIAFFANHNPRWQKGEELCCLAEMTVLMPLKYALKKMIKAWFR